MSFFLSPAKAQLYSARFGVTQLCRDMNLSQCTRGLMDVLLETRTRTLLTASLSLSLLPTVKWAVETRTRPSSVWCFHRSCGPHKRRPLLTRDRDEHVAALGLCREQSLTTTNCTCCNHGYKTNVLVLVHSIAVVHLNYPPSGHNPRVRLVLTSYLHASDLFLPTPL